MSTQQKQKVKSKLKRGKLFVAFGGTVIGIAVLASFVSAAEKTFAGKTITVLQNKNPYYFGLKPLFPEFEAKTGMKVNIVAVPAGELRKKLLMDFVAHAGMIDVPWVDKPWVGEFVAADYLYPLDDLIKRDAEEIDLEDFLAPAVEAFRWRGKQAGLALCVFPQVFMYRKDLYSKFGLDIPKTLDEYLENCRNLTRDLDGDGKIDVYGIALCGKRDMSTTAQFLTYAALFGGWLFKSYPEEPWDFTPTVNSPAMLEALKFYKEMQKYAPPAMVGYSWFDAGATIWNGTAAQLYWFLLYGAMTYDPKKSVVVGKVGFGLPPTKTGIEPVYECGASGPGINADSRNKEAAWEFIKWELSKETVKKIWENEHAYINFPRRSVYEDPEILNTFPFVKWGKKALVPKSADIRPRVPAFAEISEILSLRINQVLIEALTPEEALNLAQKEVIEACKGSENW